MPYSHEAEEAVISCAMQSPDWLALHLRDLNPEVFHHFSHRALFVCMVDMAVSDQAIDPVTLTQELRRRGELESIGGPSKVSECYTSTLTPQNRAYYLGIVRQAYLARRHISALQEGIAAWRTISLNEAGSSNAAADTVKGLLEEAGYLPGAGLKRRKIGEVADQVVDQIMDRLQNPGKLPGWSTGFRTLDSRTGGMQGGHVWVMAGLPGDGKSSAMQNMAEEAALAGAKVGWYPLEMPDTEQVFRLLAAHGEIPNDVLYSGMMNRQQQGALQMALQRLRNVGIDMVETDGATATDIINDVERGSYDVVVIDYLQLMEEGSARKSATREEIISGISRRLKRLAKRSQNCILTGSQLNDGGKLRESRAIGQDADKVILINKCPSDRKEGRGEPQAYGEETEYDDNRRIWFVDKNRGGRRHFELPMHFHGEFFQFTEIEP